MRRMSVLFACLVVSLSLHAAWTMKYDGAGASSTALTPDGSGGAFVLSSNSLFRIDGAGVVRAAWRVTRQPRYVARGANDAMFITDFIGIGITKIDAQQKKLLWSVHFDPTSNDDCELHGLVALPDGGVVAVGNIRKETALALRLDANGRLVWMKAFDASGNESLQDVLVLRNGDLIVAGRRNRDGLLMRLSGNGEIRWQQIAYPWAFEALAMMPNGEFVAAGFHNVTRFDADGRAKWQRTSMMEIQNLAVSATGVIAVSGMLREQPSVLSFDGAGALKWQKQLPRSIAQRKGLIASSEDWLYVMQQGGVHVLRIDPNGTNACMADAPDALKLEEGTWASQSLSIDVSDVEPNPKSVMATLGEIAISASSFDCATLPRPQSPTGPVAKFDQNAHITAREAEWRELFSRREYAKLDQIAEELRKKPWSADPMHWDIDVLVTDLSADASRSEEQTQSMLREWMAQRPQSVLARVALAQALVRPAASRRGSGYGNTVTQAGGEQMMTLFRQADELLASTKGAEDFGMYWDARIKVAQFVEGESVGEIARLAAKRTADPFAYLNAAILTAPKWGGSPQAERQLAEQISLTLGKPWGEVMYMWIAYQAYLQMEYAEYRAAGFDWNRIAKGSRDLIALAPAYLPTYHRFALLARRLDQRAAAREMFEKPELSWYEGAELMWRERSAYEAVREWALRPAEAYTLKPREQWPQIVMQSEANKRPSFFVATSNGTFEFSVLPLTTPRSSRPRVVATKASQGNPPVMPLTLSAIEPRERNRVFVVICQWNGNRCAQKVIAGEMRAVPDKRQFSLALDEPLPQESEVGGAVLDEDGHVIGVTLEPWQRSLIGEGRFVYPAAGERAQAALP